MPTKPCEICHKTKPIEDKNVCCSDCADKELDLLMATYAFIHCSDTDYCPVKELLEEVPSVQGTRLNQTLINCWIGKNWLDRNDLNSVCVPPSVYEEIQAHGFSVCDVVRSKLIEQKEKKNVLEKKESKAKLPPKSTSRSGMIYMEKKKDQL